MSRTDKTKPWRVRILEHHPVENHNHRRGVCDLPESPLDPVRYSGCYWSESHHSLFGCCMGSCNCNDHDKRIRKAKRKRERAYARRYQDGPEEVGRAKQKKNTVRWCKGRVGRKHEPVVRWASWASWRLDYRRRQTGNDKICQMRSAGWHSPGWQCYHEIGCSSCGKILKFSAGGACPDFPHH